MRNAARGSDLPPLAFTPTPIASLIPQPEVYEVDMAQWVAAVKVQELKEKNNG
jgi:hypothetical protein